MTLPPAAEYNFAIGPHATPELAELFFGPLDPTNPNDRVVYLEDVSVTYADLMVMAGVFPSLGQARKNGHGGPIPNGFSDIRVGKLRRRIVCLKLLTPP